MLVVIGAVDLSLRAALSGVAVLAAAYGVHRRLALVWWVGCLVLAFCFVRSIGDVLRGPQTPLAMMCSVLAVAFTALAASWWWRQKIQFVPSRDEKPWSGDAADVVSR